MTDHAASGGADEDADDPEDDGLVLFDTLTGQAPLGAAATAPPPPVARSSAPCPWCGARVPEGVDACPACLSPLGASGTAVPGSTPPAAWRLVFRGTGGHLEVPPGAELRLGRDADWAPEAAGLLAGETSVSARHALVAHGEDGAASVTEVPQGATNGVRVNDRVLSPGRSEPLRDGDTVWLGPWVALRVCGPGRAGGPGASG